MDFAVTLTREEAAKLIAGEEPWIFRTEKGDRYLLWIQRPLLEQTLDAAAAAENGGPSPAKRGKRKYRRRAKKYSCDRCDFVTDDPHAIGGHRAGHTRGELRAKKPRRPRGSRRGGRPRKEAEGNFECKPCGDVFNSESALHLHQELKHGVKFINREAPA